MNYFDCHCDTLTLMDPARDTLYSNSLFIDLKRVSAFADRYTQIYAIFDDVAESPEGSRDARFEQIYAQALDIKPAGKSEELRLEQALLNIDVAKGGYMPTLSLSAGAGTGYYTSSNRTSDNFGSQMKNNFGPHAGLNLSIPIFSRNSNRNNVRSAQLSMMNQEMQLDNAKKQLYKEIQQAYYNAVASRSRYESSREAEASAQESFDLVHAKYEGGKAGITEFNESKNRLVTAQADVLKYRYEYLFNTALLEFYRNSTFEL